MIHLPELINDLGFILIAAAVVSLIFKRFKQPVVLGYLIAGIIVGPYISFTPTVVEADSLKIWAEIGVIFLLFGLGLEFSFKKLIRVGTSASITALFEFVFMVGLGFASGLFLGWPTIDILFLGGILSISSINIIFGRKPSFNRCITSFPLADSPTTSTSSISLNNATNPFRTR